ncbi:MAG TPA: TerB family tellurite resistance protein [Kofleriaceae bacterium]
MTSDRVFPLCELLMGIAYADGELDEQEKTEVRSLMIELAGEARVEVEACIQSFEPEKFDMVATAAAFKKDPDEDRRRLLVLACTVAEANDERHFAEDDYIRALHEALDLPASALDGLVIDVSIEDLQESFEVVSKGPPPLPPAARR